jgi:hydrogenase maturation protease
MTTLIAGLGNVFLGDDGFGVEVIRRIDAATLPDGVVVEDYGIRGVHLAYELLDGRYDTVVLVDAVPLDEPPGTVVLLDASQVEGAIGAGPVDAHSMSPDAVLQTLRRLGGHVERVYVVGCRPAVIEEHMGLSTPVLNAVDEAVAVTVALADTTVAQTVSRRETVPVGHAGREQPLQGRAEP